LNVIVRPLSSASSVILSPSILPFWIGNCSSSLGPTVPVMSLPLCLSTNTAVDSLVSPLGFVALKLPAHFPVTSRKAATASAAAIKKHRSVRIVSLGKNRRQGNAKVPSRLRFFGSDRRENCRDES